MNITIQAADENSREGKLNRTRQPNHLRAIRLWLGFVIAGLVVSGLTALTETNRNYPFLAYGTDWLAFAHLVIAVAFVGPYRDPVRNKWIITISLIACAGVFPLALIAGQMRGIPIAWRLLDCSFGVFAGIPLLLCRRHVVALERVGVEGR